MVVRGGPLLVGAYHTPGNSLHRARDAYWKCIFHEQLNSWMHDPGLLPPELTRAMFRECFDCELSTMIWDMLKTGIKPLY